jgi:hypothetical protein
MNRIVVLGVALFFALVGIALVGGENKASAFGFLRLGGGGGYGCCGGGCCGGGHHNRCHSRCHGGGGCCNGGGCCSSSCHGGHHRRCHGGGGCCGGYGGCCGGVAVEKGAIQAPAPVAVPVPAK